MKKYIALALLVSFAGVHAADGESLDNDVTPTNLSRSESDQKLDDLSQQSDLGVSAKKVDGLGDDQPAATVNKAQTPVASLQERFKNHPWAALGGGFSASILALIAGARDPQKIVPAMVVGAGFGMAAKEGLDKTIPQLPDDKFSNMAKGVVGPLGVRFLPNVVDWGNAGTRSIRGN